MHKHYTAKLTANSACLTKPASQSWNQDGQTLSHQQILSELLL